MLIIDLARSPPATRLWYGLSVTMLSHAASAIRSTLDRPMHGGSAESPMWRKRGFSKRDTSPGIRVDCQGSTTEKKKVAGRDPSWWLAGVPYRVVNYRLPIRAYPWFYVPRGQSSLASGSLFDLSSAGSDLESKTSRS
ncbi:hypothetical protein C8Q69DRAFT_444700 [Paecilomyces variotii]|uniref:Uncharacterized protein n=1 Tax=Byssochlamys spectabilis TaxID=264951 RepID=A0A443HVF8_BYSSP|nr:hypothetical protein C8Q69DRAFT_444700 [Paecilomyces variotii]RWQ95812.1 hypothetical protein C8Q69DRAFT_444700 [Paecilomyces variotii]